MPATAARQPDRPAPANLHALRLKDAEARRLPPQAPAAPKATASAPAARSQATTPASPSRLHRRRAQRPARHAHAQLSNGTLTAQGLLPHRAHHTPIAITSATGTYNGARGTPS